MSVLERGERELGGEACPNRKAAGGMEGSAFVIDRRSRQGRLKSAPHGRPRRDRSEGTRESSGAKEHGFALEHLDGQEEGYGGIQAGGNKNDGDEIPVVSAGDEFFAE